MYTFWTKGLDEQQKKDLYYSVSSGKNALKILRKETEKERERVQKERKAKGSYDTVNWSYLQADLIGEERALDKTIKLLNDLINEAKDD